MEPRTYACEALDETRGGAAGPRGLAEARRAIVLAYLLLQDPPEGRCAEVLGSVAWRAELAGRPGLAEAARAVLGEWEARGPG